MNKKVVATPREVILFIVFFCLIVIFGLSILFYLKSDIRLFILFFISFILYGVYYQIKSFIYLKVETEYIKTGLTSKYTYGQVQKVVLYDVKEYRFLFLPIKEECLTIIFEDGRKVNLKDNFYKNLWKIRWILDNKVIKKNSSFSFHFKTDFNCDHITNKTTTIPTFVKLAPYLLYFFFLSCTANLTLMYYEIYTNGVIIIIGILGLMTLLISRGKSFYMESCDNGIFIKNLISKGVILKIPRSQIEHVKFKTIGGGRYKTTFLVIHMNFHKDYKFPIDFISFERTENIIDQIKKLNLDFYDLRYKK